MRSSKLRAFLIALMLLVFAAGLAFLLYPSLWGAAVDRKISLNAQGFLNRDETAPTIPEVIVTIDSPTESEETRDYPELWADMVRYNETIYTQGQAGLSCEQKKAVRAGYDMDIIPSDLATYGAEAKKLLSDLQSRNQRMFLVTFLILNTADTKRQLDNNVFQTNSIAQKYNCSITALDYQQEEGMVSSLPLGLNQIEIQRGLTSSGVAIFVPFTTQELFQDSPEALYYGINALSNNIIMVDRKLLKNPNGLILGTPGSGKSFSAKREISNVFLATGDDIMICDPEGEYFPLVQRLEGQVIKISPTSRHHINPMDINLNYSDEENPLSLKSDFILSLCELIVGGKDGLQPVEKTIIDRCVRMVYQDYLNDPKPENMPILDKVQETVRRFSQPHKKQRDYLLKGIVFCGCCDHALSYVANKQPYFHCRRSQAAENGPCHDLKVDALELEQVIFQTIKAQLEAVLSIRMDGSISLDTVVAERTEYERQIEALEDSKQSLFEQYIMGEIDVGNYKSQKAFYDASILKAKNAHAAIAAQAKKKKEEQNRQSSRTEIAKAITDAEGLTPELVSLLIEKVYIFPDKRIEIAYKVNDLFD